MRDRRPRRRIAAAMAAALLVVLAGCSGAVPQKNATPPDSSSPKGPGPDQSGEKGGPAPAKEKSKGFQPLPGYQAANFTATDVRTGKGFTLTQLRGQVVFLNFWATWCPPCKAEMPEMQKLQEEMGDKVRIIGLGADPREPASQLASFGTSMGLTFTLAYDRGIAMEAYQVRGIPTSYFIDKDGVIRFRHMGPMTLQQMKEYIAETEKAAAAKQ